MQRDVDGSWSDATIPRQTETETRPLADRLEAEVLPSASACQGGRLSQFQKKLSQKQCMVTVGQHAQFVSFVFQGV